MNKLLWKLRIIWLSLRWIPQVNLGDYVHYRGGIYMVYNGVRCGMWRLGNLDDGKDKHNTGWVKRSDCRKVWSLTNIRHSFRSGYNFYMTSWYDIWCREGIKGWMKDTARNLWK